MRFPEQDLDSTWRVAEPVREVTRLATFPLSRQPCGCSQPRGLCKALWSREGSQPGSALPTPPGGTFRPPRPLPSRALDLAGAPGLAGAGPTSPPPRPGQRQRCPLPGPGLRGPLWPATPALLPCVVSPGPRRPREGGRPRSRLRGLRGLWAQAPRRRRLGAREPGRGRESGFPWGQPRLQPGGGGVPWLQDRGAGQGLWRIAQRWRGGGRGGLGGRYRPHLQKRKLRPERERDEPKVTRWSCPAAPPAPPPRPSPHFRDGEWSPLIGQIWGPGTRISCDWRAPALPPPPPAPPSFLRRGRGRGLGTWDPRAPAPPHDLVWGLHELRVLRARALGASVQGPHLPPA